jgi:hypothetical protein
MLALSSWMVAFAQDPAEPTAPAPAEEAKPWDRVGWGWGALPTPNYNADEGFGFGALGSIYRYDGHTAPYKTGATLILFMTTRQIHGHSLEIDTLEVGDTPLRLTGRAELAATLVNPYCGTGPAVTCDPAVATAAGEDRGLAGDALDEFARRYYYTRWVNPNGFLVARYALDPMPHRIEAFAGWRLNALVPGSFSEAGPWPGSLYARDFPGGEIGVVSVLQLGLMADDRDNEPAPIRGYWVEGSIRGATPVWGSQYDYFGFNTTLRGYVPVGTERLVLANRVVFDGMVGDAHVLELASFGGSQRYFGWGGLNAGRGIRLRRYVGRVKSFEQAELRWTPISFRVANVPFDVGFLTFGDLGFVAADWSGVGGMFDYPLFGTGGGLRVAVDKNLVVRADLGVSPLEGWSPAPYIDIKNTF